MRSQMKIGVVLPTAAGEAGDGVPQYGLTRSLAVAAEAAGLDSIWVSDHLVMRIPGEPETGAHEAWTVLSALAEATSRVEHSATVGRDSRTRHNPDVVGANVMRSEAERSSTRRVATEVGSRDMVTPAAPPMILTWSSRRSVTGSLGAGGSG